MNRITPVDMDLIGLFDLIGAIYLIPMDFSLIVEHDRLSFTLTYCIECTFTYPRGRLLLVHFPLYSFVSLKRKEKRCER
jgi:hypothetical protein